MSTASPAPNRRDFLATSATALLATSAGAAAFNFTSSQPAAAAEASSIRPFTVSFPQEEIDELRRRIAATRWPERELVSDAASRRISVDPSSAGANARRATRHDAETHPVLGNGIRLEQVRGASEGAAAFHHRDRRPRHPLHPREIQASGCAAGHHHARLARFGHRAAEDHRSAHQPHGAWRNRSRCVRRGDPVDAGLRLFRQADRDRLGSGAHRAGVDRADEAPRLRPVCRAGRRLGRAHHRTDGSAWRLPS